MNSSDDDDIIEIESSTDSQGNLNTENKSEAENGNVSKKVKNDTVENEAKESEQETSKGQMKAKKFAEGAIFLKPREYTGNKAAQTKMPKPEKASEFY